MKISKHAVLYIVSCLFLLLSVKTDAQPWLKEPYYTNSHPDSLHPILLKDVQKSFEAWQEDHTPAENEETNPPKGDEEEEQRPGWLQFKRWEHYMKPRVYPSGDISLPSRNYQIFKDYETSLSLNLAQHPEHLNHPLAALSGGWVAKGPNSVPSGGGAGRINFIRFNPSNSNTIWIGSPAGGLWKSTNAGTTWSTNTDELSVIGCSDIAINPLDTNIMYLATGDGDADDNNSIGVLKSTDGGNTWNTTGLVWPVSGYYGIYKMLINPNDTAMVILASNDGIWLTTNSGANWSMVQSGSFTDIAFKPGTPSTIYAVSSTFYISTNSGASFTQSATGLPTTNVERLEIGVSAANSAYVYVLAANKTHYGFRGLYLSSNSGASFSTQSTTPNILGYDTNGADTSSGQGWYDLSIAVNPTNASDVYVGGVNHWRSTNAGVSWTCITQWYGCCGYPYVHADVHNISFLPGSGTTLYSGNDGGIFESTNNGAAWTDHSANLEIAEMYALGVSATDSNLTITGHQDNGTNLMDGSTWSYVIGGDGMDCLIANTDSNIMYGEIYYGEIYKSTNKGGAFNDITTSSGTGVNAQGDWVTPFVMHPTNDSILLVGKYQLFRTLNAGSTWAQAGTLPIDSPDEIIAIAYAPSNPNYIYVATSNQLFVSVNNGSTYTNITGTLPVSSAYISNIGVSNTNPAKVWVTFSGYSSGNKVYASANTGSTWTNYSTGLPNLPVNCIAYQNNTNDGLYAGTDVGVYFISNSLSSWQPFYTGMPDVVVDDLEIQYQMNKIRAATFGRGLWQSGLAIPVPLFSASQTTACTGTTVAFTDQSAGSPTGWNWTLTGATPATSSTQNPSVTYSAPGTYPVTLKVSNSNGSDSITITSYITVVSSSVGGTATASAGNLCSGSTATLTLAGDTGNIQWQSSTNNLTFANISGATSATYTSPALTTTTYYRAVVTNSICASANSKEDTIIVYPHSIGGTATATSSTLCSGNSNTLTLTGNTGSIQWQSSLNDITFSNINGATSAVYSTPVLTANTYYRAVVTSGVCASANSSTDTITVNPLSLGGMASVTSGVVCSGSSTSVTLTGNTGNIQWQSSADNLTFTNISGATSANYITPAITATTYYRAEVTNGICPTVYSTTDSVTVNTASIGGTVTTGTDSICAGNGATLNLTGNTGNIQWQSSADNITYTNIASATSSSYTTPGLSATTYYRAVVTNGVCPAVNSVAAEITVNPVPFAGTASAVNGTICSGNSATVKLTGSSGNVQWQSSPDNITFTNINAATSTSYTTLPLTSTTYYRAVVTSGVCPAANSTLVIVNVTPASVGGVAFPVNGILCSGNSNTINLSGYTGNIQWQSSPDDVTFTNIGGANSSVYNTPALNTTTYYLAVVTNGICPATNSTTATVIVNPSSIGGAAVATNTQLCSGNATTITLTGNTGNIHWQSSADNINFSNINGAVSSVYNTPVLTATTYYRAIDSSYTCPSAKSTVATVTVNPLPPATISANGATTFCPASNVVLSASPGLIYHWSNSSTLQDITVSTAGSFTVTVTDNNQCSAVSTPVTTTVLQATAITAQPLGQQTCTGGNVTLQAMATGVNLTYQWVRNSNPINQATLPSYNIPAASYSDSGKYFVVVSGTCGAVNSDTVPLTITPTLIISQQPVAQTTCQGQPVTISVIANGANTAYQWTHNGNNITGANSSSYNIGQAALTDTGIYACAITSTCGNLTSNQAFLRVNPVFLSGYSKSICADSSYNFNGRLLTASGTYYDTLTAINGCDSIVRLQLNTLAIPSPVIIATGDTTFCDGNSVTLSGSTNPAWHYQWQYNGANITGAISSGRLVNNNSGLYDMMVTDTIGCTGKSNSILVTINPLVVPAIVIASGSGDTICAGASLTFTSATTNAGNQPQYQWKVNGANAGTNASFSTSTLSNNDMVSCVLISSATCASPDTITSDSIYITVNPTTPPVVSITESTADTVCMGTPVTLTATVISGGNSPSYLWKKNGVDAGTGPSYTDSLPLNEDIISVLVTSSNSCANPPTALESDTIKVAAKVTPSVSITALPSGPVCAGTEVIYTAVPVNGGLAPTYQWKKNGTATGAGGNTYINNNPANGDATECELTTSLGCVNSATVTSNTISLVVYPLPATPVITQNGNMLVSSAASGNQWFLNNVAIAGATGQDYTPQQAGLYTLVVTNAQQCSSDTSAGFNYVTGINTITGFTVKVYPNPANRTLFIQSGTSVITGLEVIDMLGQTKMVRQANQLYYELDVSELAAANYLLVVHSSQGVSKTTFNVER